MCMYHGKNNYIKQHEVFWTNYSFIWTGRWKCYFDALKEAESFTLLYYIVLLLEHNTQTNTNLCVCVCGWMAEVFWQEEGTAVSAVTANVSEIQSFRLSKLKYTHMHTELAYIWSLFVLYLQYYITCWERGVMVTVHTWKQRWCRKLISGILTVCVRKKEKELICTKRKTVLSSHLSHAALSSTETTSDHCKPPLTQRDLQGKLCRAGSGVYGTSRGPAGQMP